VLVRSNGFAIHGQRRVAVADWQVAENLIVGAIFFQHVDHVADRIFTTGKFKPTAIRLNEVVFFDLVGVGREILVDIRELEALYGTANQRCNIRIIAMVRPNLHFGFHIVRSTAFAFSGGDEQIVVGDGQGARVPLGGDEADRTFKRRRIEGCSSYWVSKTAMASSEGMAV